MRSASSCGRHQQKALGIRDYLIGPEIIGGREAGYGIVRERLAEAFQIGGQRTAHPLRLPRDRWRIVKVVWRFCSRNILMTETGLNGRE